MDFLLQDSEENKGVTRLTDIKSMTLTELKELMAAARGKAFPGKTDL